MKNITIKMPALNERFHAIGGLPVPDGIVQLAKSERKYVIKDSTIVKVLVKVNYETNRGAIIIEQQEYYGYSKGDFVFQNNQPASDGKYRLGFMKYITVVNGQIIKKTIR